MRYRSYVFAAALCAALMLPSSPSRAQISLGVSVNIAPPALPVYEQPPLPAVGYIWAPGYWAWSDGGYYWVPGTWVEPPEAGLLWTPGYWGWSGGNYFWHEGYWGPEVGFYGGVNYGFGYGGVGYDGGHWSHGAFYYNRAVNRIPGNMHITHVYNKTVIVNNHDHVSFNGGRGGIQARPNANQLAAERGRHLSPVTAQRQQEQLAGRNPQLRSSSNHGRPPITATPRPGQFGPREHAGGAPAAPRGNSNNRPGGQSEHAGAPARNVSPRSDAPVRNHTPPRANLAPPRTEAAPRPVTPQRTETTPHANPQRQSGAHAGPAHAGPNAQAPGAREAHPQAHSQPHPPGNQHENPRDGNPSQRQP